MNDSAPSVALTETAQSIVPTLANLARAVTRIPPVAWLVVSGVGMTAVFWFAFGTRYSLDKFGTQVQQSIATLNNYSAEGAFLFIASFVTLFALYGFAMRFGARRPERRASWIVVGIFAVLMNLALLPMHIFDAADLYDYIIRGRMSAVYGLNPLHDTPAQVSSDEFYYFAAWRDVSSAYGPLWEMIASVGSRIAGNNTLTNVIVFKLIAVIGYVITIPFLLLTLRLIAPKRALVGFLLFAWNPLVIYMTAGGGHNDSLMMAAVMISVYCLVRRWYVAGTVAALLGALIKFMPVLLIPIIAIIALRDLPTRHRIRYILASGILCGVIGLLCYAPYWTGLDTLSINRREQMYTGSIATLVRQTIAIPLDGHTGEANTTPRANQLITYAVIGLMAVFYLFELTDVYEDRQPMRPIRAIIRILLFYMLVTATWFQGWYVLWVIPLAALLDNAPMRRFILLFSYLVTWQSFLYNYVTLRALVSEWAPLPWRDLVPIGVVMGTAWAYIAWFWISTWLRSGTRSPYRITIGNRLRSVRLLANLPLIDLADDLALRTDDLTSYERGEKAIPIDTASALCERLNISITDLVQA